MPTSLIIGLLGYLAAVIIATIGVVKTGWYVPRIILALLLLPAALFCLYGFAATFEPADAVTQWSFRIGYVVVGLALAATILVLLFRRRKVES